MYHFEDGGQKWESSEKVTGTLSTYHSFTLIPLLPIFPTFIKMLTFFIQDVPRVKVTTSGGCSLC
jgi:hypothetical protein